MENFSRKPQPVRCNIHLFISSSARGVKRSWEITEWVSLEGNTGAHLVQTPLKQGPQALCSQDCVQTAFESLQRRLHNLSGQPVPVLCLLHSKEVPRHVQVEIPVFQCKMPALLCVLQPLASYSDWNTWIERPIRKILKIWGWIWGNRM